MARVDKKPTFTHSVEYERKKIASPSPALGFHFFSTFRARLNVIYASCNMQKQYRIGDTIRTFHTNFTLPASVSIYTAELAVRFRANPSE